MKLSTEYQNGLIIFFGITVYFLFIIAIGFGDKAYLRLINTFFVFYGVNRTLTMNIAEGKMNFVSNAISAMKISLIGVFLSIIGLVFYSYMKGGESYIQSLSETFLFGGNPSATYSICLLFEGIAPYIVVTMLIMLYWNHRHSTD